MSIIGNTDTTRFGNPLYSGRDIYAVAKDIVIVGNDITDMNADAKFEPRDLWNLLVSLGHAALDFNGASRGVDGARKLHEHAIASGLDDASAMFNDFGIDKRLSE